MGKSIIAFCFMFIALLGGAVALPVLRQTMLDGGPNPFVPSGGSSSTGGSCAAAFTVDA
jgi:hypothetical protein